MKKLNIDYYIGGYNLEQISNYELAYAYATGAFSHDNYYFYCYFYSIYKNWIFKPIYDNIENIFGLTIEQIKVHSAEDLILKIKSHIDNNEPILIQTRLNRLFFSEQYEKVGNICKRLLLVDGYNENLSVIRTRQFIQTREFLKSYPKLKSFYSDTYVDLNLKTEYIIEIWENSIKDENEAVYIMKKTGEPRITSYKQLLDYYVNNLNGDIYEQLRDNSPEGIRNRFYNAIVMFCDIIKRCFEPPRWNNYNLEYDEVEKKLNEFLQNRNILVSKIIKDVIKNNTSIKDEFVEQLRRSDKYLYNYISLSYNQIIGINNDETEVPVNFALNATITADSEGSNALAVYAVDGKIDSDYDCWCSTFKYDVHWLVVDLREEKIVSKFIIKHHPHNEKLITKDFRIEGSMDSKNWDVLIEVRDNSEHSNELRILPVKYRYFRLYITNAGSLGESAARIFSFEIY